MFEEVYEFHSKYRQGSRSTSFWKSTTEVLLHILTAEWYRVIEKSRNPVWYVVLATNECDEVEFVDGCAGMTAEVV